MATSLAGQSWAILDSKVPTTVPWEPPRSLGDRSAPPHIDTHSGGSRGVPFGSSNSLFVVLRPCIAGLVCAHECSRKRSGQRNPHFQNPKSDTDTHTHTHTLWCTYQPVVDQVSTLSSQLKEEIGNHYAKCNRVWYKGTLLH